MSQPTETVFESVKYFVTINRNKIIIGFILFVSLMYLLYHLMMGVGVVEKYQPEQPIAFSHEVHAGLNGVDCNYCHSSAKKSAHSGVPSANVCMNCHTQLLKEMMKKQNKKLVKFGNLLGWILKPMNLYGIV